MRPPDQLAYLLSQTARMAWFASHYLATKRLDRSAAPSKERPAAKRRRRFNATRWALINGALNLIRLDAANIRAQRYCLPRDLVPNPFEAAKDVLRYYRDLPRARARRLAQSTQEVSSLSDDGNYPDYYLQNFHYQTDGYLSHHSAELYDFQVEVLFTGTADAMRRQALPPIGEVLGQAQREGNRLLDVACGTGGFLATVQHCWPTLGLTGLDISQPYLERAKSRTSKSVEYVKANAENMPLQDGSADIVTCIYLLHELPRDARSHVIREIARVLRPGGRLIVTDSLQLGDTPALDPVLRGFPETFHEPYYNDYLEQDIKGLLGEADFSAIRAQPAYLSKVFVADEPR